MARTFTGHAMGGSTTVQSVKIRKEWEDALERAASGKKEHFNSRHWTEEENALIIKGRSINMGWSELCLMIGCSETTARKQWRKLTTK